MIAVQHRWALRLSAAWLLALLAAGCGGSSPPATSSYPPPPQPAASGRTATVVAGDTLYGIAKKTNVPVRALIEANRLSPPYTIYPGQKLALPGAAREHLVKQGETLYSVSRDYGVDSTTLARANNLAAPYALTPGTRLKLPEAPARTVAAAQQPAPAASPAPQQQQTVGSIFAPPLSSGSPVLKPPPSAVERVPLTPTAETPPQTASAALPEPLVAAPVAPPAQLAPLAAVPPRTGQTFEWPLKGKLLARYGAQGKGLHNDGINISARAGSRVRAAESGVIAYAGNELRGFGNLLLIKHADGWITAYAHNDKLLVARGDTVRRGQQIAVVGATGNVSEPQLHFEIRRGERALDPLKYLGPATAYKFDVTPAQAGVQATEKLDSRFRGNDNLCEDDYRNAWEMFIKELLICLMM